MYNSEHKLANFQLSLYKYWTDIAN